MSSHAVNAFGWDRSAFFKSAGTSCTTPLEIFFCDTDELTGFGTSETKRKHHPTGCASGHRKLLI
jgi:hypothetical protein